MNDNSMRAANNIRALSVAMVEKAKSGHPGGAMGGADFIHILFSEYLRFDPSRPEWFMRDRFFLDPGHMSPMLYSELALCGFFTIEDLKGFRQWGSLTPGHPELDRERMIENTSGPLGQGHTMAVGSAIAERFLAARFGEWISHRTYTFISDGGIQEEIAQGAGRIAGHLGLKNLVMFYDSNKVQLSTMVDEVTTEDTASKYRSWGWNVIEINGNDHQQIRKALNESMLENEKPTLIIGHTVMGKGLVNDAGESMEGLCSTHGQPVSKAGASPVATFKALGADPKNPFMIFPDVQADYDQIISLKQIAAADRDQEYTRWKTNNPESAAKLERWLNNQPDNINFNKIELNPNQATRAASAQILNLLGQNVDNMIVASADLSNSDKTDGFLKHKKPLKKGDFSGGFLNAGVSELTMAAISNGIALHGGITVACGTFFVFSDYMKPAVRMSALMRLPVIYIWSHDAFRVGEDGPTHQPIEQEAQIRLMEHVRNHHNERSMLVLRPADADETTIAWRLAFENRTRPTALILSRQNIAEWPENEGQKRSEQALQAAKGAYVISSDDHPDLTLIASGSEVSTLMGASIILRKKYNIKLRVVSVISEGLFRDQPVEYQQQVIPSGTPAFGLTAGLPVTLAGLVGSQGYIYGLSHFGYSAPAEVLDQRFGFTPEAVAAQIFKFLNKTDNK